MKNTLLFLFSFFVLALTACAPAATPDTISVVETVVVTEIVEGEAVEVIVTTTPEGMRVQSNDQPAATLGDEPGSAVQMVSLPAANRMVIKDAELEVLVRDTDQSLASITQMASDYGGYLINSQTWYDGEYKYASLRLAVPSATFETALNNLRILGLQVLRETASGQDVGAEYVDLQTRLANLEATAARVREFLASAKTVQESLNVSAELSELEGQIEQIKGQMGYYEGRTAFSTVTVYLTPERPTPTPTSTPTATPGWNPGKTFEQASGQLIGVSQGAVDALIWFGVVVGPFLVILIVLVGSWRLSHRKSSKANLNVPREP